MGKITYEEYLQEEFKRAEKCPLFWAFSEQQLNEALEKRSAKPAEVCRIEGLSGAFCLKKDLDEVREYFNRGSRLDRLMTDSEFRVDAFYYEMRNHEYGINYYQGNWDVLNCFSKKELKYRDDDDFMYFLQQLKHEDWADDYRKARQMYFRAAKAGDWF